MITDIFNAIPLQWVIFSSIICGLLIFDLGVFSKHNKALTIKQSLLLTLFYITIGVSFGFVILNMYNPTEFDRCSPNCHVQAAGYYWNAFIIEKVLSIDNISTVYYFGEFWASLLCVV
jgi:tellurite resistance protein TerC